MDKSSVQLSINPVGKVASLSAVASIGTPVQTFQSRADHLAHQHAGLAEQLAANTAHQTLQKLVSTSQVSATAQFIDQSLQQAKATGVSTTYMSPTVLTQTPTLPHVVTQQLKTAITQSGLFYESHLGDLAEGHRSLAEIKQEPQNKPNFLMQTLLPQQLHILEQQRLSWHGEVWQNQQMDWDVYVQNRQGDEQGHADEDALASISSDLTLHLPRLGKVTAKISMHDGRMRIGFLAEQEDALQLLKTKRTSLVSAIEGNGQVIERLTLNNMMEAEHGR